MRFTKIPRSPYLNICLGIIRKAILEEKGHLQKDDKEDIKNQKLTECFQIIANDFVNSKTFIGVGREHVSKKNTKEDIYFFLNDKDRTRVFFVEGKRLPKYNTKIIEEYVKGEDADKPSGGIERFKLGIHGDVQTLYHYGIIGYIETDSIRHWLICINRQIKNYYPNDKKLVKKMKLENEYTSTHEIITHPGENFTMHHFLIDLTSN